MAQEWTAGPPGGMGLVGRPFQRAVIGLRPSRNTGYGWEALLGCQELSGGSPRWLGVVRRHSHWAGSGQTVLLRVPGVVRRPFRSNGCGREALPESWDWSGGPPDGPQVVRRLSRLAGNGRKALLEGREWLGVPPRGLGVIGIHFRRAGSGQESLP